MYSEILFTFFIFILYFIVRAYITKYTFIKFSIPTPSIWILFKKYLLIMLIIVIPIFIIGLIYIFTQDTEPNWDYSDTFIEYAFYTFMYPLEAFLISKIIQDVNGNKITLKIAFILVFMFFISDRIIDTFSMSIDTKYFSDSNISITKNNGNISL